MATPEHGSLLRATFHYVHCRPDRGSGRSRRATRGSLSAHTEKSMFHQSLTLKPDFSVLQLCQFAWAVAEDLQGKRQNQDVSVNELFVSKVDRILWVGKSVSSTILFIKHCLRHQLAWYFHTEH